jgi:hypothetical protein
LVVLSRHFILLSYTPVNATIALFLVGVQCVWPIT